MLGEVTAAADGSFDYPRAAGAISCADAQALTTTTTLPGTGWATSEFSPDLACPAGETPKPGD